MNSKAMIGIIAAAVVVGVGVIAYVMMMRPYVQPTPPVVENVPASQVQPAPVSDVDQAEGELKSIQVEGLDAPIADIEKELAK